MKYFYWLLAATGMVGCASANLPVQSPNRALERQENLNFAIRDAVERQECFDNQVPAPHCRQCLSQP